MLGKDEIPAQVFSSSVVNKGDQPAYGMQMESNQDISLLPSTPVIADTLGGRFSVRNSESP